MSISQNNQVEDLKTYIVEVAYPDYLFVKVVATSEEDALELVEYSSDINEVPETYIEGATEVGGHGELSFRWPASASIPCSY